MFKSDQITVEPKPIDSIEVARQEKDKNFRIHSKADIHAIIRDIMQRNTLVTVYFDQGNNFILTSILTIDTERDEMVIDYGIDERLNRMALNSKRITFITSQNRIKVEFACDSLRKIHFEGDDAFVVNMPDTLVRMQRRNFFRVTTPTINPLKCVIPFPIDDESDIAEVTLLDISCGGIAVIDHHPKISFDPGTVFENCQILLPNIGTIIANIQVKNTYEITLRNGLACKRAGCEFIRLPASMFALIQRYIVKLEQMQKDH
ncbi:MAG: flagellar brake protein [Nitrosomonas sp.]|nr:flagellar brake protein [Nitrosomonas sp.]